MKKPLVLIVDDNVDNIAVIEEILKEFNYDFNSITDPTVILDVLEYKKPDLILLDYFMPEQDGYETLEIIKSNPEYGSIPIIILTAESEKSTLAKFMKAGAVDYLNKPVNYIELEARISSVLKINQLTEELKEQVKIVKKQNDEIDMFTSIIVDGLKKHLSEINKYTKLIEQESNDIKRIKFYVTKISAAKMDMNYKIDNVLDVIGVMKEVEKV